MSILKTLLSQKRHREWIKWADKDEKTRGPKPLPGFKDCSNCTEVDGMDEDERRPVCKRCPIVLHAEFLGEELPDSPDEEYLTVEELADLPEFVLKIEYENGRIDRQTLTDLNVYKRLMHNPWG